ncbi:MAG TPA: shikimate kinase I [Coxiellaceae bacterium]|nr:shikimate kinase I [Coxiellaceae bacterium]HBS51599.1 shikimate kinase I [Coxiellaceae bacterium]HBY55686.1 shikimate kinase I [Coxiellaceae bacterium]
MRNPLNIVLVGPMGAGKTSMGKALAKEIGWDFCDSDQIIEERAGVNLLWIYDLEGEVGFRSREQKVIAELTQKRNIVLATGGSTVAIFENRAAITANGLVIYLCTSLDDQLVRTGYSKKRPLSPELEERRGILKRLHEEYVPIYEELADIIYNTDNKSTRSAIADLVELIKKQNASFI